MARPKNQRTPATKVFQGSDGYWHGYVLVGEKPDGKLDRRHRMGKDRDTVVAAVLELEDLVEESVKPPSGKPPTAGKWWKYWLTEIAPLRAKHNTLRGTYRFSLIYLERLARQRLSDLAPEHFNRLYKQLLSEGLSPKSVMHVHTTAVASLEVARRYSYIRENPAKGATPPSVRSNSPRAIDGGELDRILPVINRRRSRFRWFLGLLGPRQGEVLGAGWPYLDRDTGILRISRRLERRTYSHGCGDARACAAPHCVTECSGMKWHHGCSDARSCAEPHCGRRQYPSEARRGSTPRGCPSDCRGHARACPDRVRRCSRHDECPRCAQGCQGHASKCPQRRGGLILVEPDPVHSEVTQVEATRHRGRRRSREAHLPTKTPAGDRRVALPPFMIEMSRDHERQQRAERRAAGNKWEESDLIMTKLLGGPVDPSRDWAEWGEILEEAGVEYREPHVTRKTAATLMLKMGMERRIVMAYFGWASETMLKTYQDVPDELLIEAAQSVGRNLESYATRN